MQWTSSGAPEKLLVIMQKACPAWLALGNVSVAEGWSELSINSASRKRADWLYMLDSYTGSIVTHIISSKNNIDHGNRLKSIHNL